MLKNYLIIITLLINSFFIQSANGASKQHISFANTVEELTPTVVNISTSQKVGNQVLNDLLAQIPKGSAFEGVFKDLLKKQTPEEKPNSTLGSGFIISEDGYIVTNNHVIGDASKIEITLSSGKTAAAEIIGRDKKTDIALIKVNVVEKLKPVKFGDSDKIRPGDWVIAVGNPFGLGGSVTAGIISARGREISGSGIVEYFQTDTAINRGNSGGPMFNDSGELVGIATAIFTTGGGNIGIGFAIPSNTAKSVISQLKDHGSVTRGWLGVHVQDITDDMAEALDLQKGRGAYVVHVAPNSPAEKAGLEIDDIIIEFDNKAVEKTSQLPRIVGNTTVNKKVTITILRKANKKTTKKKLNVIVKKLGAQISSKKAPSKDVDPNKKNNSLLGLHLVELSKIKDYYEYSENIDGLIILSINADSTSSKSGLQTGDLVQKANQTQIHSVTDLQDLIQSTQLNNKENILLTIKRGANATLILTVKIPKD
ncbi:MAG: Do family serine endopeptidase [Rickettsiales bacterium]|jgi:serine protease Do|nr:Do family serine endopeptidase [Rickettsiales bacterium]